MTMRRREFLKTAGAGLVSATSIAAIADEQLLTPPCRIDVPTVTTPEGPVPVPFVRATPDRIISLTVCTRPFRANGVRLETERLGRKTIVHNYGHGGSGWSLSWGSATFAVREVLATRVSEVAVIGAGVIGLTSAIMAQRAGLKVRIYAKDRWPDTRSTFATGTWSPNSRYCTAEGATPEVAQRWEEMTRISYRMYQNLLGLPGDPIEWRDGYYLADSFRSNHPADEPEYPDLEARTRDLTPRGKLMDPGTHPFPTQIARRFTMMIYNLTAYSRMLMADFLAAGGVFEAREFEKPGDIAKLREKTVIHCTGYGARALFGDESITPVRGQLMRLVPQPEVNYALQYEDKFFMSPRRDGILLQTNELGDFGNVGIAPDRAAAERTVQSVADLNDRIRANLPCK
jgi:glycine/D-amino acid oxidase-like deaminating enzyme